MNMADGAQKHPYHLVDPSPWPALGAIGAFLLAMGAALAAWATRESGRARVVNLVAGASVIGGGLAWATTARRLAAASPPPSAIG